MADHIQCENILMSERGVFEVQAGKQVDGVLRADIDHLRVAYATGANRPFLEGIMGAVLFAAGLKGLWLCFQSIKVFGIMPSFWRSALSEQPCSGMSSSAATFSTSERGADASTSFRSPFAPILRTSRISSEQRRSVSA